jgi:hypothetical protein
MSMSTRTIGAEEPQERLPESQQERSIALFQHRTLAVKLYAPVISFARANAGSLDRTISCLFPREWNIDLKISAMISRCGSSFTDRKVERRRRYEFERGLHAVSRRSLVAPQSGNERFIAGKASFPTVQWAITDRSDEGPASLCDDPELQRCASAAGADFRCVVWRTVHHSRRRECHIAGR